LIFQNKLKLYKLV